MKSKSCPSKDDFNELHRHTERHKLMNVDDHMSDNDWIAPDNKRQKYNKGKQPAKSASRKTSPTQYPRSSRRLQQGIVNGMTNSANSSEVSDCPMCYLSFPQKEIEDHASKCDGSQCNVHEEITLQDNENRIEIFDEFEQSETLVQQTSEICPICQRKPNLKTRSFEEHVDLCLAKGDNCKKTKK